MRECRRNRFRVVGVYGRYGGNPLAPAVCPLDSTGAVTVEACDEVGARLHKDRLEAGAGVELGEKPAPNLARSELQRQQRDTP